MTQRNWMSADASKIDWHGTVTAVQPRTRIWRYRCDNRSHFHIGYNLFISGESSDGKTDFVVAISEKQQQSSGVRIGDVLRGTAWTKLYPEREFADYNRAGALKRLSEAANDSETSGPPWQVPVPDMQTYESRGARMLSLSCWKTKCRQCAWAAMANVEIAWDCDKRISKYRFESFCYGPKSCKFYNPGKARTVPYRGDMPSIDDGWMDALCTEGRDWDD